MWWASRAVMVLSLTVRMPMPRNAPSAMRVELVMCEPEAHRTWRPILVRPFDGQVVAELGLGADADTRAQQCVVADERVDSDVDVRVDDRADADHRARSEHRGSAGTRVDAAQGVAQLRHADHRVVFDTCLLADHGAAVHHRERPDHRTRP